MDCRHETIYYLGMAILACQSLQNDGGQSHSHIVRYVHLVDLPIQVSFIEEYGEENVHRDDLIDCILRIPHSIDLHNHPLVLSQSIILQTKASCFPPYLLLRDLYDGSKQLPERCDVIDATAAPGNKTTFLGDILRKQ